MCIFFRYRRAMAEKYLVWVERKEDVRRKLARFDIKLATDLVANVWKNIPPTLIANCFRHAGWEKSEEEEEPEEEETTMEPRNWSQVLQSLDMESCDFEEYALCDNNIQATEALSDEDIVEHVLKENNPEPEEEESEEEEEDDGQYPPIKNTGEFFAMIDQQRAFMRKHELPDTHLRQLEKQLVDMQMKVCQNQISVADYFTMQNPGALGLNRIPSTPCTPKSPKISKTKDGKGLKNRHVEGNKEGNKEGSERSDQAQVEQVANSQDKEVIVIEGVQSGHAPITADNEVTIAAENADAITPIKTPINTGVVDERGDTIFLEEIRQLDAAAIDTALDSVEIVTDLGDTPPKDVQFTPTTSSTPKRKFNIRPRTPQTPLQAVRKSAKRQLIMPGSPGPSKRNKVDDVGPPPSAPLKPGAKKRVGKLKKINSADIRDLLLNSSQSSVSSLDSDA